MEAPPGFEPGMEVLQTSALPLGDGAGRSRIVRGIRPRQMMRQQQRDERPILMIIVLVNALQGGRRSKSVPHGRETSKAATVVQLRRAHQAPAMTKEAFWKSVLFWAVLVITGLIVFFFTGGFE